MPQVEVGDHFPLISTGETYLECWIQFWSFWCRKDMDLLEQIQERAAEMIKGLQNLSYEEWLRFGREEAQGDFINESKYRMLDRAKKRAPDSVAFSEGTRGNRHKLTHRKLFLNRRKSWVFLMWWWSNTGVGSPERL